MHGFLRSLWNEPRPPGARGPSRWDGVLVAVCALAALAEGALRPDLPWAVLTVAVVAGLSPALLWRRARPLAAVAVVFGGAALLTLVTGGGAGQMYTTVYFLALPYALVRWGSGREVAAGAAIVLLSSSVDLVLDGVRAADLLGGAAVLFATGALGAALRYRSRARAREIDRARLIERENIARELHDTVAHHVSAMAIRAQAGQAVARTRPEAAIEALAVIESEASRALGEMRTMVRALRRDELAERAPGPGLLELEELACTAGPGPAVQVEVSGELDDLAPAVAAALHRMARESVTNARRHARDATLVTVRVDADDTSVRLSVRDDGDTGRLRPTAPPGYGIIGMAERAELLGGSCEAAPAPDGGWTVTAVLPRSGETA
ncbi:sensor histidine kinase [Nocardiopsis metallicus]|uniref:histidine kinase n=1 Tax=Nocardiopsis metallicus TaxID=179819 RepID=A0A840WTM6_9ACTN|nr:sensor histidine kinase [Nocardiopsis metallicus]MBB5494907.1 signal transduction histidine kinase [Nocardiopsis metallicus]